MLFESLSASVDQYIQEKKWYWYAPFWPAGAYAYIKLLQFDLNRPLALILIIPQSFDFMLHEITHIVLAWTPPIICAASGSLSEILFGAVLTIAAFKTRSYFIVMISSLWFMLACQSAGVYMADARSQRLVLFSLGAALSGSSEARHDWHFVFGQLHILPLDTFIGGSVRCIGDAAGLAGLAFTAWVIYKMYAASRAQATAAHEEELRDIVAGHAKDSVSFDTPGRRTNKD